jgi:tripartite-type tricarboxylate transporter receptor subunit TctC
MEIRRRRFLHLAAGAVALPAVSRIAKAQSYPTRPITMIVPLALGSAIDVIGRVLADRMSKFLLQPIVVENVTGAEGSIGAGRVARARPDGYTVAMGAISTHVLNGALYSLPYDVLNGFASISPVATAPYILFARNTMPAKDLKELIAWLKANPNKASAGISFGSSHVLTAFFQKETGTRLALVPYRGNPFQDLAAGHIDLTFAAPVILPLLRAGNIKAYAVTNELRFAPAPDVPTFAEIALPELSYSAWAGLFAPKGTPNEVINKLNAAAVEALADPAVRSRLADLGFEIFPRERQTPEALAAMQKADAEKWWPIIKELGIKPQ